MLRCVGARHKGKPGTVRGQGLRGNVLQVTTMNDSMIFTLVQFGKRDVISSN